MSGRRFCLCLTTVLLTVTCTVQTGGGAASDAGGKTVLNKENFVRMMTSISNWGRWGKDDQRGSLNLITPEKRRAAAALVKEGFALSLAKDVIKEEQDGSPAFGHRMVQIPKEGQETSGSGDEYSVNYHGFSHTHMDGLSHMVFRGKMYNGFSHTEVTAKGAHKLGVENIKDGIFTRCVLMDIPRLSGVRYLPGNRAIHPQDLEAWERKAGVKVESGDAVLIRTGRWLRREQEGPWNIAKGSAGLHASCLPWLKDRGVAVVGSDLALDVLPSGIEGFEFPVHYGCIVALGVPILDNCDLERLSQEASQRNRWAFLLTAAPLAVGGGTGSPINPIATF
jgi:kynurenine formamidase